MVDVSVSASSAPRPRTYFWPRWQSDMKSTSLAYGPRGEVGAVYRYVSKVMGMMFRGIGRLIEPLITFMGRRLNNEHLEALRMELEKA